MSMRFRDALGRFVRLEAGYLSAIHILVGEATSEHKYYSVSLMSVYRLLPRNLHYCIEATTECMIEICTARFIYSSGEAKEGITLCTFWNTWDDDLALMYENTISGNEEVR